MEQSQAIGSDATTEDNTERVPLWNFFPLREYRVPAYPARSSFERHWNSFKNLFRKQGAQEMFKGEDELRKLEESRLASLLAEPDWKYLAEGVDLWFEKQKEAEWRENSVRFLVGPPCGGKRCWAQTVEQWAALHDATVVAAPGYEEILAGDSRWLEEIQAARGPWVLAQLEKCYLRHVYGLTGIRHFFELVEKDVLAPGLVACDSWAWSLFGRLWPIAQLDAFTLQEFDADRLLFLLSVLTRNRHGRAVCYRNASTGEKIFVAGKENESISSELVKLAAHSRGNFTMALQLWRSRLRTEPDTERDDVQEKPASEGGEDTIWITSDFFNPILPQDKSDLPLFLHAMLLHNGLSENVLPEILPVSRAQGVAGLTLLEGSGIIEQREGEWVVSSLGYGRVREYLHGHDYLVDML